MSLGREGFFASKKKPVVYKKRAVASDALWMMLDSISRDIRVSPQVFYSAVGKFSDLINKISKNSYQIAKGKETIALKKDMLERIEELLRAMQETAKVIDAKQQELDCYGNAGYVGDARADVALLVARYMMRRGSPQAALGLFQNIEKHYPGFGSVYYYHIKLLNYLKMHDQAKQVEEKRDLLVNRDVPSLEERTPGHGRPAYSFGCSI